MKKLSLLIFFCSIFIFSRAQYSLVTPTKTDNNIPPINLVPTIEGMNVAQINYFPTMSTITALHPYSFFFVEVDYGFNNSGNINIVDPYPVGGSTISVRVNPVRTMVKPDVVVGNDYTNPNSKYHIAVAYMSDQNKVYIDYYEVNYSLTSGGGYTFSVNPTPSTTTVIEDAYNPHLDIISEESNTSLTGLPFCDNFVITWNDCDNNIFAQLASITSPPTIISSSTAINISSNGIMPDVAAVQRVVSSSTHNVALLTYVDAATSNILYYAECDFTAGSVTSPQTLDPGTLGSNTISNPRIDAIDMASISTNPMWSTISQYKVVAQVDSTGQFIVRNYDNLLSSLGATWTSSSAVDITSLPSYSSYSSGYNHYSPCVAANFRNLFTGQPNSFLVSHYTVLNNSTSDAFVFMEPVDWQIPNDLEIIPGLTPVQNYYLVNTNFPNYISNSKGPNAITTSCNIYGFANEFVNVWATNNPNYDVFYKLVPTFSPAYSYKGSTKKIELNTDILEVYPNPIANIVVIDSKYNIDASDTYIIEDVIGRKISKGEFKHGIKNEINTSSLHPGIYFIKMFLSNNCNKTIKIVKE